MKFSDESQRPRFKNGRIILCKVESLENREWAPFQFTYSCKAGEELKTIPLDADGGCPDDAFSSVAGPCMILIQDWNGVTYMTISKE